MPRTHRLSLGPGPGPRLLAPGLPDRIVADGRRIGWGGPDGAWLVDLSERVVLHVGAGAVDELVAAPGGWVAVGAEGVTLIDPVAGTARRSPVQAIRRAGGRWAVTMGRPRIVDLFTGRSAAVPMGGRTPSALPWTDGPGLTWWDGTTLYRAGPDGRARVMGTLPSPPIEVAVGPAGAALFVFADQSARVVAPGCPPVRIAGIARAEGASFSADGRQVLAVAPDGVGLFDTATGERLGGWAGAASPAGFAPAPLVLDEDEGRLVSLDGQVALDGLVPAAVLYWEGRLYGPGAAAWDLQRGRPLWRHRALAAEELLPIEGGVIAVTGEDALAFGADGAILGPVETRGEPPEPPVDGDPELLDADGRVVVRGRAWEWTADGVLVVL